MESIFKIFLLTILSCCYINTVFEFSDTEKKANFENESHNYIPQDNNNNKITTPIAKAVKHFDITFDNSHQLYISAKCKDKKCKYLYYKYFKPPDKLFLLYTSLLFYG